MKQTKVSQTLQTSVFLSIRDYKIDWRKCIAISSDGAKAMTGTKKIKYFQMDTLRSSSKNSASQGLSFQLHDVLNEVINIVNSIKDQALQTRLFRIVRFIRIS